MYQEKMKRKTALTHRYNDSKTIYKNDTNNHDGQQNDNNYETKMGRKTTLWRFKRLINSISYDRTGTGLRKGNFQRETESLLIAAQDNAIRTNHIKARIDKTQQKSKCSLCSARDETINHIKSECSKLAQWVGKVIH